MRDHTRNLLMNATMDDGSTAGDDALAAGVAWITQTHYDLDTMWLLLGAILVFFMQTGFAMLEVGTVSKKNTSNILLKNVMDASIGAVVWAALGFGFALGPTKSGFIGDPSFFITAPDMWGDDDATGNAASGYWYAMWLFQWAFAATTATIVSGAVAERCTFQAYLIYSIFLTGFVYPVVVCWGWNTTGWASAWKSTPEEDDIGEGTAALLAGCGVIDFAGSGVVHMTGGVAAFWGSFFLGPRKARQPGGKGTPLVTLPSDYAPEYGPIFQTLGTLILWMGWYGFNGVSTLYIVNYGLVAAKTMVTTTIAAGTGGITTLFVGSLLDGKTDGAYVLKLGNANNGVLAGLVAITAPCSTCEPIAAFLIGIGGSMMYLLGSKCLEMCKIDDVVGAVPVHGFCGFFGVICAALFATPENYGNAYYSTRADKCAGVFMGGDGSALGAAIQFLAAVFLWVSVWSIFMFGILKMAGMLRVTDEVEEAGMDSSEHGVVPGGVELKSPAAAPTKVAPAEAAPVEAAP